MGDHQVEVINLYDLSFYNKIFDKMENLFGNSVSDGMQEMVKD